MSELDLHGYAIERVHDHGRLLDVRLAEPDVSTYLPHDGVTDGRGSDDNRPAYGPTRTIDDPPAPRLSGEGDQLSVSAG